MKTLLQLTLIFVLCSTYATAQQISLMNDETGQPSYFFMTLPDTTYIHHFKGEIPEYISFGDKYKFSPRSFFERNLSGNNNLRNAPMDSVEPGLLPEADLPYKVKYSNDGSRIIMIYHHSNNVVVYDAGDLSVIADINVGKGPEDLFVSDNRVYVACYYSDDIYVINLDDYSIEDHFNVDSHPSVIEVNQNEDIIYIGFDLAGHYESSPMAAYGLSAHNRLWESDWPFIEMVVADGNIGRRVFTTSRFELIGNDQYIACLKSPGLQVLIIDAISGDLIKTFDWPGENVANLTTSVTKDTLFAQSLSSDSLFFYKIDSYTHNVLDFIGIPNPHPMLGAYMWQDNLAVNYSGTKMFLELLNLDFDGIAVLIDFETNDYKVIEQGINSIFQINVIQSFDKRFVVSMAGEHRIFDFELEDYTYFHSIFPSDVYYKYTVIAPSPVSYEFAWGDFMANRYYTSIKKNENVNVFNFDDPTNLIISESTICGEQPEADLTETAVWNSKYEKLITANPLSGSISIIDVNTYEADTILDIEGISSVKQVTDDHLLMGGKDYPYLLLFDIPSLSVIKQFNLTDAYLIIPSPDQQYAYAFSRWDEKMIKIKLDGADSKIVKTLLILDGSALYLNWEYIYRPEISPDGKYIVMSEDHTAIIIDTETLEVVSNVSLIGDYMFDMAFTEDSKRLCIAYWYTVPYFDIVYLDGENSYLENTVYAGDGIGGMSVDYNQVDGKFYIARRSDIWVVEPTTGTVEETINYNPNSSQLQICIDPQGKPIVNTFSSIYHDGTEYFLGEPTRPMHVDFASQKCIIPSPGPDKVYILDFLTTQVHEVTTSKVDDQLTIYPNPASDHLTVKSGKLIRRLQLFDNEGALLFDKEYNHAVVTIGLGEYPEGIYFVNVYRGDGVENKKLVVVR
ncbi:MAG: T9SS type A sorting domain-containing protein [Bacteroidota bacterium]